MVLQVTLVRTVAVKVIQLVQLVVVAGEQLVVVGILPVVQVVQP